MPWPARPCWSSLVYPGLVFGPTTGITSCPSSSLAQTLAPRSSFRHRSSIPCLHRPATKPAAQRSKLAVKISEADKWKPRTDLKKEKERPAPKLRAMLPSTASWLGAEALFKKDYLKEFREKNPKDKSSGYAVLRKASKVWRSLSNSDKAPYEARALAAATEYRDAVAKTKSYRKTWDLKCKMEVEMDKMNL